MIVGLSKQRPSAEPASRHTQPPLRGLGYRIFEDRRGSAPDLTAPNASCPEECARREDQTDVVLATHRPKYYRDIMATGSIWNYLIVWSLKKMN